MSENLTGKLNPIQIELLKLFSTNVSDEDLLYLKKLLLDYRLKKATEAADKAWEDNNWIREDADRLLKTHLRTPYKSQETFLKKNK